MSKPDIAIEVKTQFHPHESSSHEAKYVFSYQIRITNHHPFGIKLISRYWHISDAEENVQEVNGQGVIGQQPEINSGESFQYTSGVILSTPAGVMHGYYDFVSDQGEIIQATIPLFALTDPSFLH